MDLSSLTMRNVRDAIKYGHGVEGLCSKYSCDPEALFFRMESLYGRNFNKILQELRESDKKQHGSKKGAAASKATDDVKMVVDQVIAGIPAKTVTFEELLMDLGATDEATAISDKLCQQPEQTEQPETNNITSLVEGLKDKEAMLSKALMGIECDYNNTLSQHRAMLSELRTLQHELKVLEGQFNEKMAQYQKLAAEDDGIVDLLSELMGSHREKATELNKLREKIKRLDVTTICAYADGTIAIFEGPEVPLDKAGADDVFNDLIKRPECEDLKLKQIKLLSEVLAVTGNSNKKLEVLIEDQSVQKAYELLSATSAS